MAKQKLRGKDLIPLGYTNTTIRSLAMQVVGKACKYQSLAEKLALLEAIIVNPIAYKTHADFSSLAHLILDQKEIEIDYQFTKKEFKIYGKDGIAANAITQMEQAMSLPVAVNGALMPDAHHGYGLPIGGVLATENALIPYGVGVDIGCRMSLSIFEAQEGFLNSNKDKLRQIIVDNSRFGRATFEDNKRDDAFFDRPEFSQLPLLRRLQDKAYTQIGSSGGGNHFVEFGLVKITARDNDFGLELGNYLALLTHSGSRGFGAMIANTYTQIAMKQHNLPKSIAHLSWLDINSQAGQEYWLAMNLAGDYAAACHHHIHRRVSQALGMTALHNIENHHNFAWKEMLPNGKEVFVHRKGATPAHQGEWGIIPGSMTAPAFVVRGLGNSLALNSAAHGAGRQLSRKQAKNAINKKMLNEVLKQHQVDLISAGLDEAPFAYKDIHQVMAAQQDLVRVVAPFHPKIVRME